MLIALANISPALCLLFIQIVLTVNAEQLSPSICPKGCKCLPMNDSLADGSQGFKIICTAMGLPVIPDSIDYPRPSYGLSLDYNSLEKFQVLENVTELRELDLSNNHINDIEPRAFETLPNLVVLNLGSNKLTKLPSTIFHPLVHLKVLDLSGNSFTYLPVNLFDQQSMVIQLLLNKNLMKRLDLGLFDSTVRLETLDLSENQLTNLPGSLFANNFILKELDLAENLFSSLPVEAIQGASSLEKLVIDANPIRALNHKSLPILRDLKILSIRDVPLLMKIEELAFSGLCRLKELDLSENHRLKSIDPDAFFGLHDTSNCSALEKLHLNNNGLTKLSEFMLPWCKLDLVHLHDNPWICDCNLKWMRECRNLLSPDLRCNLPLELSERDFDDLSPSDFRCDDQNYGERIRRFIVMIVALVTFFITGLIIAMIVQRTVILDWFYGRKKGVGSIYYVKAPIHITE